jgi:DNA-binding FadR family transcriptional regulator
MIEADVAFHNLVYGAAGNPLIGESTRLHWHHIQRAMGLTLQVAAARDDVWDEHAAILEAVNAGDGPRAERLARQHCESAGRMLSARLAEARARDRAPQRTPAEERS